jgi:hypothetical protein
MKDTPEVNGINTLVGKGQFQKGMFIYIIFFNANTFEKSVTAISKAIAVSLYTFEFGFVTWFSKHELYKACGLKTGSENSFERM